MVSNSKKPERINTSDKVQKKPLKMSRNSLKFKHQKKRSFLSTIKPSSSKYAWQNLPDLIFTDILMMVGLGRLDDISKGRRVCQSWNVVISQMTKRTKDTIRREAESQAAEIREKWGDNDDDTLPEIANAASLAHHGILGSVKSMDLENVDLASIPAEHLASLASCVTEDVNIDNICDIIR